MSSATRLLLLQFTWIPSLTGPQGRGEKGGVREQLSPRHHSSPHPPCPPSHIHSLHITTSASTATINPPHTPFPSCSITTIVYSSSSSSLIILSLSSTPVRCIFIFLSLSFISFHHHLLDDHFHVTLPPLGPSLTHPAHHHTPPTPNSQGSAATAPHTPTIITTTVHHYPVIPSSLSTTRAPWAPGSVH